MEVFVWGEVITPFSRGQGDVFHKVQNGTALLRRTAKLRVNRLDGNIRKPYKPRLLSAPLLQV